MHFRIKRNGETLPKKNPPKNKTIRIISKHTLKVSCAQNMAAAKNFFIDALKMITRRTSTKLKKNQNFSLRNNRQ